MPILIAGAAVMYLGSILSGNAGTVLIPNLEYSDTILPSLLVQYGSPVVTSIFFCGIASASLSTANSQIHAVAAIYTIDIYRNHINKKASEKKVVDTAKKSVVIISAIAYILMLQSPGEIIMKTGILAMGGTAQIAIPTVGGLLWKRSNSKAAFWGLLTGIVSLIILYFFSDWNKGCYGPIALIINLLIFITVSLTSASNVKTREKIILYKNSYRES